MTDFDDIRLRIFYAKYRRKREAEEDERIGLELEKVIRAHSSKPCPFPSCCPVLHDGEYTIESRNGVDTLILKRGEHDKS